MSKDIEQIKPIEQQIEEKCCTGCKKFYGGEIKHHKDCVFYPESLTSIYDAMQTENAKLREALKWISVEDKLPEDDRDVLIMLNNDIENCLVGYCDNKVWEIYRHDEYRNNITHWRYIETEIK